MFFSTDAGKRSFLAAAAGFLLLAATSCAFWNAESARQRYFEQGNSYYAEGKYGDAELAYRKAVAKDPQFGEGFHRLGLTQLKRGRIARSVGSLRTAAARMPKHVESRVLLSEIYLTAYAGDTQRPESVLEEAKGFLKQLNELAPKEYETLRLNGQLAYVEEKRSEAERWFREANTVKPRQVQVLAPLAEILMADKRGQEGEKLLLDLIATDKTNLLAHDVLYRYYLSTGREREAEAILQRLAANDRKSTGARVRLAAHHVRAKQQDKLEATLNELATNREDFPNGSLVAGDFYGALGEWDRAKACYETGAKSSPEVKLTFDLRIAEVLVAQQKLREADGRLDEILREHPGDTRAREMKAVLLVLFGEPEGVERAVKDLKALVQDSPESPHLRYQLARAYVAKRETGPAEKEFREALRRRGDFVPARIALAELAMDTLRYKEALQEAGEVLRIDAGNRQARLLRAAAQVGLGEFPQARTELSKLIQESPQAGGAHLQMALLEIAEKRYPEGESILKRIYQPGQSDPQIVRALAELYSSQGNFDRAVGVLEDELRRKPAYEVEVRRTLAETAARANRTDLAIQTYTELVPAVRNPEQMRYRMSELYYRKGDVKNAIAQLEEALRIAPENVEILLVLGSLKELDGRAAEARQHYRRALAAEPDNAVALNNLAFNLCETGGNLDEALSLAQRATQRSPDQPSFSDTLGWVYLKRNMAGAALQVFDNLVRRFPENPIYRYHHAMALLKSGQKEKARTELEATLSRKPDHRLEAKVREAMTQIP